MAEKQSMVGDDRGVSVAKGRKEYVVGFEFDRELVRRMHQVDGAEFSEKDNQWHVPLAAEESLDKAVKGMRFEHVAIAKDREDIFALSKETATAMQRENGAAAAVSPQLGDYKKLNGETVGVIINANARFAAQFTGFGKEDGAAFVTVHRMADLDNRLFKGDRVAIAYDEKGKGAVTDRSQDRARNDVLGEAVDGVKVSAAGDNLHISFQYNPALEARLRRVAGVEYSQEANCFVAPISNKDFVMRAVHDMRGEFIAEQSERASLESLAVAKMDGAVVKEAFVKDGFKSFGVIIGVTDRFVLQAGGQNTFNVHRKDALTGDTPVKDHKAEIIYQKGRGALVDKTLMQAKDKPGLTR